MMGVFEAKGKMVLERSEYKEDFTHFLADAHHRLEQLLVLLEHMRNRVDEEEVQRSLHYCHALKGGAQVLGLISLELLLHRTEQVLMRFKKDGQILTEPQYECLLGVYALVGKRLEGAETNPWIETEGPTIRTLHKRLSQFHWTPANRREEETDAKERRRIFKQRIQAQFALCATALEKKEALLTTPDSSRGFLPELREVIVQIVELPYPLATDLMVDLYLLLAAHSRGLLEAPCGKWIPAFCSTVLTELHESIKEGNDIEEAFFIKQQNKIRQVLTPLTLEAIQDEEQELHNLLLDADDTMAYQCEALPHMELTPFNHVKVSNTVAVCHRLSQSMAKHHHQNILFVAQGQDVWVHPRWFKLVQTALIQLVRNACSHGIESIEGRIEAGKDKTAEITLDIMPGPEGVLLSLSDDGQGVDRMDVIRRGAHRLEGKLVPWDVMIFWDEVSTTRQGGSDSGRGYGLNMVKEGVERLGGTIKVKSEEGKGTTFIMTFPWESIFQG